MIILVIIFLVLIIINIRLTNYNSEYINRETTKKINGIFVFLIIISHFSSYIKLSGTLNETYVTIRNFLDQLVVTTFLFYSGYGILEAIKSKKGVFINSLPKRALKLLIHMDIVVLLFAVLGWVIEKNYSIQKILLALIGWENIGNSNWYIFDILILYILTFLIYKPFNKNNEKYWLRSIIFLLISICFVYLLKYLKNGKSAYWYNTILCYNAGIFYSLMKERIDKFFKGHTIRWIFAILILVAVFIFAKEHRNHLSMYQLHGIVFCLIITLLSMKLVIKSKILEFFGNHVFSIYILQRIPMIIGKEIGLDKLNIYLYFAFSFILTIALACSFDFLMKKLDKLLFDRKKDKKIKLIENT